MPPRGYYFAYEVGRLAGVSGNTIGQWKRRGYIRASQHAAGYPNVYAYQDIAEAMVVHELILNLDLDEIKRAIQVLREQYGYDWPLTRADLLVADYGHPARRSLVVREGIKTFDVTQHKYPWQAVINTEHLREVAWNLNHGGWAAHEIPDLKHIEVHPDRLSGRPVIRGTRVAAGDVARLASEPNGRDALHEGYDLTDDQIADAVRWHAATQRYEQEAV